MEVVNYLPGDQRLVDKIVYELKSQGIFDQFRKECFADVDTKPAYQNLRQRVEGNVTGFLKDQSWRPDMNKNQVREMLRKKISESGYLETGVERIVDQVVNPKINTIFLPKVEEVVYKFLGIQKPNEVKKEEADLLPTDLEAVSPESKDNNSAETLPELDESKIEEDESPPFEPLDEQTTYLPHEENSVDSHISGFSASHESNHSNENKVTQIEQDSQMSRNSSDSRLSIVTSDENSKIDIICDDSQSKSIKSNDSKSDDKSSSYNKSRDAEKSRGSRSESSKDRDKDKRSKDSRSRYSSSSKDASSKDRKSSSSSSKSRSKSSGSKYPSSSSRDRTKSESSSSYRDKSRSSSSSHRDKSKSKSSDKYKHSSTSSSSHDRHRKDASSSRKKDSKQSKDDHYSSKEKKTERRSTDRDSNDGNSGKNNSASAPAEITAQNRKSTTETAQNSSESTSAGNSESSESTKTPVNVSEDVENSEVALSSSVLRISKPKFASNMKEAMKLMKIRKQLAKLEKKNQLGFASMNVKTDVIKSSSINLEEIVENGVDLVPAPLENTVISQDNWDKMEAKLQQEVGKFQDTECSSEEDNDVKFFEKVELKKNEFLCFVEKYFTETGRSKVSNKRKLEDTDGKNNNNNNNGKSVMADKKRRISRKIIIDAAEKFPLPLSPAESDVSKEEVSQGAVAVKQKRTTVNKASSQRYSSDDLYKPRPTFASSRRRGAKPTEEN